MKKKMINIMKHGIRWQTTPEYYFIVESLNKTLSRVHQRDVVKSSTIRRVVTLEMLHEEKKHEIFVKHHRLLWKETLKDLLQISKAKTEWKMTHKIAAKGIPTVIPLAFGEKRYLGLLRESYFISKRIRGCETLHDFVVREAERVHARSFIQWKQNFIRQCARLLALIHQNGIDHRDLHAGNILIERNAGEYEFHLLDLDRARIYSKLSARKKVHALAQFNMFFTLYLSQADRLRFFKEYYQYASDGWHGYKEAARWIEEKSRKMCNHLYRRRDKMCLKDNKYFSQFFIPPYQGVFRKQVVRGPLADILRDPEKLLRESMFEALKRSREKTVKLFPLQIHGKKVDVIMKSYEAETIWDELKDVFRRNRAMKCWYAANALFQRRIPTALPLACVLKKRWGVVRKGYFFYEYVPNAFVLTLFCRDFFKAPLTPLERRLKRKLITQCAQFVCHLHERSIYHADLKASNILVRETDPGAFDFYLIDLDYVKVCCHLNRYQRYRNLMQLNKSFLDRTSITLTDRLAFLRAYLRFAARDKKVVHRT